LSRHLAAVLAAAALAAGCRQDMHDQPKLEPYEHSDFFADGRAVRPLVPGTVAREGFREDEALERGTVGGRPAEAFPFEVTRAVLDRGRERYAIFCSPCHGGAGDGNGMIVERGMRRPPSFHSERLRTAAPGHYFDVITNGFGVMFDYADRVPPEDRWAIAAWIRVLQRSRNATIADVPPEERARLERGE
jgi:mono/diheme cytochrome c family protein